MPSRIEQGVVENVGRATTIVALALLLWRLWSPSPGATTETVRGDDLTAALARWSTGVAPEVVRLELRAVPSAGERDWLAALARSGSSLRWSGDLQPLAVEVSTTAEPRPWYVLRAFTAGEPVRVEDRARRIATLEPGQRLASVRTSSLVGHAQVVAGQTVARAVPPVAAPVRRVALIGAAGWETKFAAAALEESGWQVDTRIGTAPGVTVGVLASAALDTARFSAAVVLDPPGMGWGAAIARFVGAGGGLVVSHRAARAQQIAALLPARPGARVQGRDTAVVTRSALGGYSLVPAARAVPLEQRGAATLMAAARAAHGRVLLSGYDDTWRWRMQGPDGSIAEHRDWWSSLVGAVAYTGAHPESTRSPESAPLAAWVAAAGPPTVARDPVGGGREVPWNAVLFAIAAGSLLFEVVLRRRRGLA